MMKTKAYVRLLGGCILVYSMLVSFSIIQAQEHMWSSRKQTSKERDVTYGLKHEGKKRKYQVHLPPDYRSDLSYPVVIYLHGGGGVIRTAYMEKLDQAADRFGFILVIPQALRVKQGPMATRWNGGSWQTGKCCGDADDVGFISKMIDRVKEDYSIDPTRIYATGISNGGLMANRLACELADKIAAIATVAPAAIPADCMPVRAIPVMDIHGMDDLCNPFDGSVPTGPCGKAPYKRMSPKQVVAQWMKLNECAHNLEVVYQKGGAICESFNKCKENTEVVFCKVKGMGHTWPSGSQYAPVNTVGPVSKDISFTQIWDFFKCHKLASAYPKESTLLRQERGVGEVACEGVECGEEGEVHTTDKRTQALYDSVA